MSAAFCLDSLGQEIDDNNTTAYNLYQMTYDQIAKFDCGSKFHFRFPGQEKVKVVKPLLSKVIDTVEHYIADNQLPKVKYNIEIKSNPERDAVYHPEPEQFVDLVLKVITGKGINPRVTIQSFDFRSLKETRKQAPDLNLAQLIGMIYL